jgi:hypothetical protein
VLTCWSRPRAVASGSVSALAEIRRYGAVAGLGFVLLFIAALIVGPSANIPDGAASPQAVSRYYVVNHDTIQISAVLLGLSLLALLVFVVVLTQELNKGSFRNVWAAGLLIGAGAGFTVTLGVGVVALPPAITFHAAGQDPRLVQTLHDVAAGLVALSGYFGAGLGLAVAAFTVSDPKLPAWLVPFSVVFIVLQMAAPVGFIDETGPFNPYDGAITVAGAITLLAWVAVLSILLLSGKLAPSQRG